MIIGVSGLCIDSEGRKRSVGSGKGEASKRLIEKHHFVEIAWADPMKRFLQEIYEFTDSQVWGTPEEKAAPDLRYPLPDGSGYLTSRHAMQSLGTGWGRACFRDTWVNYGIRVASTLLQDAYMVYSPKLGLVPKFEETSQGEFETIEGFPNPLSGVVFTDVRYLNEFEAVKSACGKMVRVTRTLPIPFELDSMDHSHSSEIDLVDADDSEFDYVINNFGTIDTLHMMVDTMLDVFKGKIIPYDETQADIPPGLRRRQQ